MAKAVGIDLGTTNSVVAVLEGGEPTVIANAENIKAVNIAKIFPYIEPNSIPSQTMVKTPKPAANIVMTVGKLNRSDKKA